jgi:P-type Ca2+ transporter type 2C
MDTIAREIVMRTTARPGKSKSPQQTPLAGSSPVDFYSLPAQEAAATLAAELDRGLTGAEVLKRLDIYGRNELPAGENVPLWKLFLGQFKDFVVILLIVASALSIVLGDIVEGLAILAIVILNAVIGLVQEMRADAALDALKKMAAPDAQVLRDGSRMRIPARDVVPGDIVYLEAGNYVPADIRLLESFNLQINESALTGESEPVSKRAEEIIAAGSPIGDRVNTAFSSTLVTYGRGRGIVVGTGSRTEIGIIAHMLGEIEEESTPLQKRLNQLGKTLSLIALFLCALVFVVEIVRNTDLGVFIGQGPIAYITRYAENITDFFILAVSLAVAAVPEGLAAVVTINLALGMREMVKRNALIRRLAAVETLGSTTTICSDKTGTLTQNAMNVVRLYVDGHTYRVTGDRYEPRGELVEIEDARQVGRGSSVSNTQCQLASLLRGALLANDALLEVSGEEDAKTTYRIVGNPTEGALVVAAAKAGLWRDEIERAYPRIGEVPFDANRKMMSTVHRSGNLPPDAGRQRADNGVLLASGDQQETIDEQCLLLYAKGGTDVVTARCSHYLAADGKVKVLSDADRAHFREMNIAMASDALRVMAVATRTLSPDQLPATEKLEHDLTFLGVLGMIDPPRPEVIPAIQTAKQAGIRTIMITGDHAVTARAIARQIGLGNGQALGDNQPQVVSGPEIQAMSDEQLAERVRDVSVFARVSPEHKVRIVMAVKSNGHVVAMTGDGVNDAPALKRADIGVAMGITGTDVSKETADMVLTDDNYASIVNAVEQGRVIYSNIRKFVFYLLGCNVGEILIIFLATLFGLRSPLTAIQLLWLNLLTDGAPALALGLEKGDPDLMRIPPRPVSEPIINRRMLLGMVTQNTALTLMVLGVYIFALREYPLQAQTIGFLALCFAELPLAYTSRSERFSLLKIGPFTNPAMQYAVLASIIGLLAVTYIPFLNTAFNTTPLAPEHWLLLVPAVVAPMAVAELTKLLARRLKWS